MRKPLRGLGIALPRHSYGNLHIAPRRELLTAGNDSDDP